MSPWSERSATLSVAAIALAPFASLLMPTSQRLPAQAALILALFAAQAPWVHKPTERMPSLVRFAISAWLLAALLGTGVGVFSHNPLRYVAGQSLSMLLLPLGALVFWRRTGFGARSLVRGLAAAALVALALHLLLPKLGFSSGGSGPIADMRLRIVPGVSFVGSSLLTGLLCLGALRSAAMGRWLVGGGALASGILVAGGFSRGQWLAGVFGLTYLTISFLGGRWRKRSVGLALTATALGFAALLYTESATSPIEESPTTELSSRQAAWTIGSNDSPASQELLALEWSGDPGLEAVASIHGPSGERLLMWIEFRPDHNARRRRTYTRVPGGAESSLLRATVAVPEVAQRLRVGAWVSGGVWTIDELRLQTIDSSAATWLRSWGSRPTTVHGRDASWFAIAQRRAQQMIWALIEPAADETVRYRTDESAAVVKAWREEGWPRRLAGAGLGATVEHGIPSFDDAGGRIVLERTNYLHNFYLFLVFKLGIAAVLPLSALLGFAAQAWQLGRRGWLGSAVLATWLAYILWSVSSPEILDFRRAALFGLVIAACAREEIIRRGPTRSQPPTA